MLKYFYLLKDVCLINPGLLVKAVFWGILLGWAGWNFFLKRPFYQRLYGVPTDKKLEIWEADIFTELPKQKIIPLRINGYNIEIQAIKSFKTVSRVVYVDRYSPLGTWYRSLEGTRLYDKIVPQDISLASGVAGRDSSCIKFTHEYRMLVPEPTKKRCSQEFDEHYRNDVSNNHSIAASPNVQRGLDILKEGDIAEIEGYAVYWNGTGDLRYIRFESAITLGQISKQIAGGMHGILCRQLLITKITFDGYTFE